MKRKVALFSTVFLCILAGIAYAESLLQPASFPKTLNDTSFVDRMELLAEGYDDYDPEYDENGYCISGCAYKGMKLEDELAAIERNTEAARQQLELYKLQHPEEFVEENPPTPDENNKKPDNPDGKKPPKKEPDEPPKITTPPVKKPPVKNPPEPVKITCAEHSNTIHPGRNAVNQAPIDGELVISSDFGTRSKPCARCSSQHRGVDLRAATGTNVYSPANGTVVKITPASSNCGIGVIIDHADGYRTTFCHFSKALVKVGDQIQGGCLIGKSGNTGASTGPHLHYGIKYNGTWIDPLWPDNRLGRNYKFKPGAQPSKEHTGKQLPGKIN